MLRPQLKSIFLFAILISAGLLSGCKVGATFHTGNSTLNVSDDSTLNLNQKIDFKPGRTRVFMQDGIIVSQFNHYQPNCNLEIRKKDDDNWQAVKPAVYQITSTQLTLEEVVRFKVGEETRLAALSASIGADDGSPSDIYLGMHFYLAGEDSNVMRLSCRGAMALPHEAEYPSLADIQQSLGNIMQINL